MAVRSVDLRELQDGRRLRIALVTETFAPEINGVALTLSRLAADLAAKGHRITVLRPRRPHEATRVPGSVRVLAVPGAPLPAYPGVRFGFPVVRRIGRLWRRERPDVVYIATEGPLGWAAARVARGLDIPAVSGYHTRFDSYVRHYHLPFAEPWVGRYLRHFHNSTRATVVPTRDLQQVLEGRGYRNVRVLRRAVDTKSFRPSRRDTSLRRTWGAEDDTPVAVWVGRIAREKNLELSVAAFDALRRECPRARMVWVGDGPARAELKRRFPGHVFAGMRFGQDLARHYASGDAFFFASETETYGNVVPEALASGLAVVAYDYGAAREYINPGTDGFLVPPGDADRFIGWASHLGRFPQERRRVQRNAPLAVAGHSPADVAGKFAALLCDCLEQAAS